MTTDCLICAHAKVHGSWPPNDRGTHCRDCHRSWTSERQVHCAVCHAHFTSYTSFDLHLRARGEAVQHLDPATLPKLESVEGAEGPVWRIQMTDIERGRLAALRETAA